MVFRWINLILWFFTSNGSSKVLGELSYPTGITCSCNNKTITKLTLCWNTFHLLQLLTTWVFFYCLMSFFLFFAKMHLPCFVDVDCPWNTLFLQQEFRHWGTSFTARLSRAAHHGMVASRWWGGSWVKGVDPQGSNYSRSKDKHKGGEWTKTRSNKMERILTQMQRLVFVYLCMKTYWRPNELCLSFFWDLPKPNFENHFRSQISTKTLWCFSDSWRSVSWSSSAHSEFPVGDKVLLAADSWH